MPDASHLDVESHSIDFVPLSERYGTPLRLFTIWFSINLSVVCTAVGALASTYGLSLGWTIFGLALGNAIGTVFMAAHSAQGPHLGVPQMVQSRAQFGVIGAGLPLVAVVITYTLYTAADGLLIEGPLGQLLSVSGTGALVIFGVATLIIAFVGYELIHRMGVVVSVISGLLFVAALWHLLTQPAPVAPSAAPALAATLSGAFAWPALMLTMTQAAAWTLSFGPYVADYSRYLPADVRTSTTFWATGLGCFLGATIIMAIGALIGLHFPAQSGDPGGAIVSVIGSWKPLVQLLIVIGVLEGNVMNVYSAYMSSATIFSGLRQMQRIGKGMKFFVMALLIALATLVSVFAQDAFETYLGDILNVMIYLLAPWSAINLADYYLVRRGKYNIPDLFRRDGEYGAFRWHTIAIYLLGVAIQIPFMSLSFFKGFVANLIGADLAWCPGLIVPGLLYIVIERRILAARAPA